MSLTTLLLIKTLPPHRIAIAAHRSTADSLWKQEPNKNTSLLFTCHVTVSPKQKRSMLTDQVHSKVKNNNNYNKKSNKQTRIWSSRGHFYVGSKDGIFSQDKRVLLCLEYAV